MKPDIAQALAEALEAVQRGETAETALARAPEWANELRPLLEAAAAAALLRVDRVPAAALRRSRLRLLGRADRGATRLPGWRRLLLQAPRRAATGLAIVLAAIVGAGGITRAAAQSLPGDILHPVKLAAEDLALLLSADNQRRLELETIYSERRLEEVVRLLALGRVVPLSFEGPVARTGPVHWDIGGVLVRLTPETTVLGEILPGMIVEVEGLTQTDGAFLAHRIHLHQYDLLAVLEAVDDSRITIGGEILRLTALTYLEPGIVVGDLVLVRVSIADDGERTALSVVRFEAPTATPSLPAPSPTPPPTTAPPATRTPAVPSGPSQTAEPDETEEPDEDDDDDEGQEVEFEGVVQSKSPSHWVIGGRTVALTAQTEIRDNPGVGDRVKVKARILSDGTWVADRIERED